MACNPALPPSFPFARCVRGVLLVAALAVGAGAAAQDMRGPGPGSWQPMEPEQRRLMRDEMREHWRQVPPEDRQRLREERHERWQQMPHEDRQRLREEMRSGGGRDGQRGGRR